MFISANERVTRSPAEATCSAPLAAPDLTQANFYNRLMTSVTAGEMEYAAAGFLDEHIAQAAALPCDLPELPCDLDAWMRTSSQRATAAYSDYLDERKAGAPRRYFSNRAHALYFLRAVAPTKLVDGAWLYGLLKHWHNPRFADLIRIYLEELGEGDAGKNHVVVYRKLLARYGLDMLDGLDDSFYTQGAVQLALASRAEDYLPEVIGFNLGYEQLPLHLLITSYELNELRLDPYYFTLHVTVDNRDTGHAKRAVKAVLENLPRLGNADDFWRRVKDGYQLSNSGLGTIEVLEGFSIDLEVQRILSNKSVAGHGAHSDYCRIGGRNINDWLARKEDIPEFLLQLQKTGWIKRGVAVEESRFWTLLQGPRAEMFGVFSGYELQLIHDWIRGDASHDGQPYTEISGQQAELRRPSFRVAARLTATHGGTAFPTIPAQDLLDSDLQTLTKQLAVLDDSGQLNLLVRAMGPGLHWTPAGLQATRVFSERVRYL